MKKLFVLMALIVIVVSAKAEILTNCDFEAGPWSGLGSGSGGSCFWIDLSPVYHTTGGSDGGAWMELSTMDMLGCIDGWTWQYSTIWTGDLAVSPGDSLTISGMAKHLQGDNILNVSIRYKDASHALIDLDGSGTLENLIDRVHLIWPTGPNWAAYFDTIIVPTEDLMGAPFASPVAYIDISFDTVDIAAIGVDQLLCSYLIPPSYGPADLTLFAREFLSPTPDPAIDIAPHPVVDGKADIRDFARISKFWNPGP